MKKRILNIDVFLMEQSIKGKGIYAKPSAMHRIALGLRKSKIEKYIENLKRGLIPDEDYKKFLGEVRELKEKYADKEERGNPKKEEKRNQEEFIIKEHRDSYDKEIIKLRKRFQKAIEEMEKVRTEYMTTVLNQRADLVIAPLYLSDFDKEKTDFGELFGLWPLIEVRKEEFPKKIKMTFKNKDILGAFESTNQGLSGDDIFGRFFSMKIWNLILALSNNFYEIRALARKIREENSIWKNYQEKFENKKLELCKIYAEKNIQGDPLQIKGNYIIKDVKKFNESLEKITDSKQKEEFKSFLEEEVVLDLIPITEKILKEVDNFLEEETDEDFFNIEQAEIIQKFVVK